MKERGRRGLFAALAVAWAGFIFWESSQANPFPFLPQEIFTHDKLLHLGAYALLAAFAVAALPRAGLRSLGRMVAIAAIVAAAYGATDEWHQSYVPGREADPWDWAADATGAVLGASAMVLLLRRRNSRASIGG